jgi:signal transduction histidine kinase
VTAGLLAREDDGQVNKLAVATRSELPAGMGGGQPAASARAMPSPLVPQAVAAASTLLTVLGVLLYLHNRGAPGAAQFFDPVAPAVGLTAPVAGSLIASRRPSNGVARVLCAGGLAGLAFFAEQYAVYALVTEPASLPAATWMAWLGSWAWIPGLLPMTTLLLLAFPGEEPLAGPRRRLAHVVVGTLALAVAATALAGGVGSPTADHPFGVSRLSWLAEWAAGASVLLLAPVCLSTLVARYRRWTTEQRARARWFLSAAVVAVAAPFIGMFAPIGMYHAVGVVGLVGLTAGIVAGVVEHHLFGLDRREIDLLTSQAVINAGMVVTEVAVCWLAVRAIDLGFGVGAGPPRWTVALVVVLASWRPLRRLVGTTVERLLSSRLAYHALISLGHRLESSIVPDEVLQALADTIAAALELPYVAVEVGRKGEVAAAAFTGEPRDDVVLVPLVHRHEVVGWLTVAARSGEHLQPTDLGLLRDLAGQVGAAAYAVRLTADLRVSRERLVTAREENWRDVRRQLHDRLGPLDGILLGIGAAMNTLARDDAPGTNMLLTRLKAELRSEIADIRALIDQLRPKSLDELGLVGALERQAALLALPPKPLLVVVKAADLGGLPSAVEVTAYQIACEAITNARRHAEARRCVVSLVVADGWLELEVSDDGRGLSPVRAEGVGLSCARERATELGGTFSLVPGPDGGTTVCAEIPLRNQ